MGDVEQEINLDEITDEALLQSLLEQTEDVDDRKAIRARIQELRAVDKAKREVVPTKTTTTGHPSDDRSQDRIAQKQKAAMEQKQRTLAMYDSMAKSAPAGGDKRMDIGIYKNSNATPPEKPKGSISGIKSSDLYEDALRQRQRMAEERKKRMLCAYDAAARSGPAGAKDVNFEAFKKADVTDYEPTKTESASTFGSKAGIAKVTKVSSSQPGTPLSPNFPGGLNFPKGNQQPDAAERMIRERQQEADERKRRTLAAYDIIAKQGAGPKIVCLEEFRDIAIDSNTRLGTNYASAAGFGGGVYRA